MKWLKELIPQQIINLFWHLPKAILANILYGFPSNKLTVIGVTGTDGKTTTVNMIYKILKDSGFSVSMVSTINAYIGNKTYDTGFHVTSPNSFSVQRFLKEAIDSGSKYMVLEVTSHALDQYRFWGVKFNVGVITNITHEHLDYHKTFENYFQTKLKLIKNAKYAVINKSLMDNQNSLRPWAKIFKGKVITFGLKDGTFNQEKFNLRLAILGEYNVENALAAIAVSSACGIDHKKASEIVGKFKGLTGRMQEVKNNKGIKVIIDFAHTPNGLEQALKTLRSQTTSGRLISVIGAEGERDIQKRPMLGKVAKKLSDIVIVTAVDPRGQLKETNKQVAEGAKKAGAIEGKDFFIIDDRYQAINFSINKLAKKGDVVGVFGKGHERSMNLDGKKEIPWSDLEAVKRSLR